MNSWLLVVFAALWVLTFIPAWKLLLRLLALSVSDSPLGLNFIAVFTLYRFVIALPYLALLIFGQDLPGFITGLIWGILILGFVLSAVRFFFKDQAANILWNIYSYVYDGLLSFYPYTNLIELVAQRVEEKKIKSFLDAGCGTGNLSYRLATKNPKLKITAVDSSAKMARRAKSKLKNLSNTTVLNLGVIDYFKEHPESKFDTIALVNVLYALEDRKLFWKMVFGHLNKGGRLIISNSDRGGSWPIIKEHIAHSRMIKLLRPSLLAVFVIDLFISQLAKTGKFHFISLDELTEEIKQAGGSIEDTQRCYGGEKDGVNLLFTVVANQ